mmetsp:Transcript_4501/g.6397  ORF Transcript_4501/g.6397 Transcript_4501/m.6397 type:complete len:295 (-) Transcript_4501:149-1033(-)
MARNTTLLVFVLSAIVSSSSAFAPVTTKRANLYNVAARKEKELHVNRFQNGPLQEPRISLNMVATEVAVGAIAGTVSGGLFSGGLHAIAGPDHLAALLPRCCGQRWYRAGRIGALWGIGHGVSACILGVLAFGLKNRVSKMGMASKLLTGASHVMEIAVGLSLVVIGLLGIKEAQEWETEPRSLSAAAVDDESLKKTQKRAVMFNGLLHGFSWDGAPSLAPALAVATWRGNLAFLLSYAVGTMAAMAVTTTLIGEGTRRAGELFNRPDIPQKLSFGSSILAIAIGAIWCGLALK